MVSIVLQAGRRRRDGDTATETAEVVAFINRELIAK
jgi:hypothetical protein